MINLLTADVYNKIAAGEVVDRPYSVVKELVENAVDAGATEISVEIEEGGKKRIRVTDNGSGMEKSDLPLAYASHATSKLKVADDLFAIRTLGFRGEAIASVAAVSKMEIVSRTAEGEAYSLRSEGGVLGEVLPAAGAKGTVVTVDDLFFNVPARLKFLKSDAQEEGDIAGVMARFLLSHPEISFTYLANGKIKYRSFGDGLPAALAAVYGAGILNDCIEIDAEKHGIRIHGFLGNRNFFKPNRTWQSLFVNGRYVVNQTVGAAVTNAYASYLMKRQYPFYVLFLDVPPEIVDVNVHPNKADVRFADNQIIYGCVYSVVSAVLDGNSRALEYLVNQPQPAAADVQEEVKPAPTPVFTAIPKPIAPPQQQQQTMSYEAAKKEVKFDVSIPKGNEPRFFDEPPVRMEVRSPASEAPLGNAAEDAFAENQRFLREQAAKAKQERVEPDTLTYKGELFRTYLIYEACDCAYLIDQHAAHERMIFDSLIEKLKNRTSIPRQGMLIPYILDLNAQESAFISENLMLIRRMGFDIEPFGVTAYRVNEVPLDLQDIDLKAFFGDLLSDLGGLRSIKVEDVLRDKIAMTACKHAVKGGMRLTDAEKQKLIEMLKGDVGLKCPHGRPVCVKMTRTQIEKMFKRIV